MGWKPANEWLSGTRIGILLYERIERRQLRHAEKYSFDCVMNMVENRWKWLHGVPMTTHENAVAGVGWRQCQRTRIKQCPYGENERHVSP
jgi:hypothetical protein